MPNLLRVRYYGVSFGDGEESPAPVTFFWDVGGNEDMSARSCRIEPEVWNIF